MKWIVVLFFLPIPGLAQERMVAADPASHTDALLNAYVSIGTTEISWAPSKKISNYLAKLSRKKSKYRSEQAFLEHVFATTHQQFLKAYTELSTFHDLVSKGQYNCLTATAWYAIVLEHLDIPYEVVETNYHIFLLTHTKDGRVLFETTDPIDGVVTDPGMIDQKITEYKKGNLVANAGKRTFYKYSQSFYSHVNLLHVKGLLWYNASVASYNNHDLVTAVRHLGNAYSSYGSPRLNEFNKLMEETVFKSDLPDEDKTELIQALRSMRAVKSPAFAMNTFRENR